MRRNVLKNNTIIEEKKFEYNTDLITKEAFELHLDLYRNYIRQANNKMNEIEIDSYNANGIFLHEKYFENIGKQNDYISDNMIKFFDDNFGSYENWKENFTNLSMAIQSKGWVALIWDSITQKYKNMKLTSHNDGISFDSKIIIISDLYEHNFIQTYGINKKEYIDNFFKCIKWDIVKERIL